MTSKPLVFLDFDGVLNGHERYPNQFCGIRPACVSHLNRILIETRAGLVISSAWRYMIHEGSMTLTGFRQLLLIHGLDGDTPVVGHTVRDEVIPGRGEQIAYFLAGWANAHGEGPYVVLDDGSDEPPFGKETSTLTESLRAHHPANLVLTNSDYGLTLQDAERAISILKGGKA